MKVVFYESILRQEFYHTSFKGEYI